MVNKREERRRKVTYHKTKRSSLFPIVKEIAAKLGRNEDGYRAEKGKEATHSASVRGSGKEEGVKRGAGGGEGEG